MIESIIATQIAEGTIPEAAFNTDDDSINPDTESPMSGPKPEGIAVGTVDGVEYAFVGLEEISGIMTFDITNPEAPEFVQYENNRIFDPANWTSLALILISAKHSKAVNSTPVRLETSHPKGCCSFPRKTVPRTSRFSSSRMK